MSKKSRTGNPLAAVAYLRVSTSDQALGLDAQKVEIEGWAARAGVVVVSWHVDRGVSGGSTIADRPGMLEAFGALEAHNAGLLVVAKRDRLARVTSWWRRPRRAWRGPRARWLSRRTAPGRATAPKPRSCGPSWTPSPSTSARSSGPGSRRPSE
ncbi:MAG: recombinase family protein [Myxococcales bacterium]|nr:recombinase family protein [Myxococcales bacterium]